VRCLGLGPDRARALGSPGPIDARALEGTLERACRGDERGVEEPEQFDADPPGPPSRVPPPELTGPPHDGLAMPRGGPPALAVADGEALLTSMAKSAPEGPDRDAREVKVDGDLREGLAVEVAADDLLAGCERDGAGHG
jgi:hypothetical protein